jgi:hypothetical protein
VRLTALARYSLFYSLCRLDADQAERRPHPVVLGCLKAGSFCGKELYAPIPLPSNTRIAWRVNR